MRPLPLLALSALLCTFAEARTPPKKTVPVTELADEARPSIVTVTQIGRGGMHEALGAGFVIRADGLIATNHHVVGQARRLEVQFADGSHSDVTSVYATDPSLDLAIIKVDRHDLRPLALGNSSSIKQGQQVVAMGHPQGLQFSVVEGVISAMRDVEGMRMIQIAMPIEVGNSGAPLLDLQGRVLGVITLKSAITENLGFAHPVDDLKRLISKPNPVPMERWLTIGRLDPKAWATVFGGRWTQHASTIHVEDAGEGFGGRALCLAKEFPPDMPFEVEVTVKLDDESGAAGLVFCSDGKDRHYGFYPSGGKLRLTRFNGPDVFSWSILADTPVPAYQHGEWNTLRVRVTGEKIECFVNDQLAIESHDTGLRRGSAGLCKFRSTRADFKKFAIGRDLQAKVVSDELAGSFKKELDFFLQKPAEHDQAVEKLIVEPAVARNLLEDKARSLEEQAASLRKLQSEIHRQSVSRELVALLQHPADQTDVLRAALLIARHDNPEIDVDAYVRVAERMADELRGDPELKKGTKSAAGRIAKYLFEENGFHGSRSDEIDNISNSHLNEVLDDREGIPITLSVVFLDLARRIGETGIYGVSLPGRFMLGFDETRDEKKTTTLIDVFGGGKFMTPATAERLISDRAARGVSEDYLKPATPRSIILRMLYNLCSFARKPEQALGYLDLILAIDPDSSLNRLNRALTRAQVGDIPGARADF
ncbi:MAG TPA: trypsin-like peptidase domain-containing protein, partial [Verrucomicrobiaceae bacterium]